MVVEALWWLRRNHAEESTRYLHTPCELPSPTAEVTGWIIERDLAEDGVGRISIFRPAFGTTAPSSTPKECLVRVLFEDGTRLEFKSQASPRDPIPQPSAGDTFRLLSVKGESLEMSFGLPLGFESHVRAARLLLRHLAESPAQRRKAAEAMSALARVESRRGAEVLWRHGAASVPATPPATPACVRLGLGIGVDNTPSPLPREPSSAIKADRTGAASLLISEALNKTRDACAAIEGVMAARRP
jgi:hypothetical protein